LATVTELPPSQQPKTEEPPAKNKGGRPHKAPEGKAPQFFDAVARVPKEDWGTRAFMYVYATEPICNAKTFGETRYMARSAEPILDLEFLKQEYGSFKGWITLNTRTTGKDPTREIDRLEFEIYDPKFPPKIPKGAWANDRRNIRWEALLPPEPTSAAQGAAHLLDSIKVYREIRDDVRDEMEPETPEPSNSAKETLETMKLAKELFAPPVTAPAADPFDLAAKVMQMRSNDPMVTIMMQRLDSMDKALAEGREREFKLQQQLVEKAAAAPQKADFLDRVLELAANSEKLEGIKKVFGGILGTDGPMHSGRTTGLDVLREIATSPLGAELGRGLGVVLSNLATGTQQQPQQPQVNGNPAAPMQPARPPVAPSVNGTAAPAEGTEQRIQRIGQVITQPMLYECFLKDLSGADWAERMFDLWPEDYLFMRNLGADDIVRRYRQFTPAWAVIAPKEPAFIEFIQEFVSWDPNAEVSDEDEGEDVKELELEAN
jgi:hypothetical protein